MTEFINLDGLLILMKEAPNQKYAQDLYAYLKKNVPEKLAEAEIRVALGEGRPKITDIDFPASKDAI